MTIPLYAPVLAPIFIAALGYFLPRHIFRFVLIVFQLLQTAAVTAIFLAVRSAGPVAEYLVAWPLGVGIALRVDLLSGMMVLLTGWMFLFLLLFNVRKLYMDNLFQFLFISLEGMLIGLFLSGDLFNVYVLMELNTLVIVTLIMYKRDKQTIYDGMIYIMINLVSMAFFLLGVGFVHLRRYRLNILSLQDRVSFSLGARPDRERLVLLVAATLATAAVISVAGIIGWVGLLVPHGARRLFRADALVAMPAAILLGAIFVVIADTLGRSLVAGEIPLGVITSLVGASGFIALLMTHNVRMER